jgi:hypothetical protein
VNELISGGCRSDWEKEMCRLHREVQGLWPVSVTESVEGVYCNGYVKLCLHSVPSLSVDLTGHSSCNHTV